MDEPKIYTVTDLRNAKLRGMKITEELLEQKIKLVCKANRQLLVEVLRLDIYDAVTGVLVPYDIVQSLIKKLRRRNPDDWHANLLKHYINRCDAKLTEKWQHFAEEIPEAGCIRFSRPQEAAGEAKKD